MESLVQSGVLPYFPLEHQTAIFEGKQLMHLTKVEEKRLLDPLDLPVQQAFSVVRSPVDRFVSAYAEFLGYLGLYNISLRQVEDYEVFKYLMKEQLFFSLQSTTGHSWQFAFRGLEEAPSNWWKPQHEYTDKTTKIWRYEDSLGAPFESWVREEVGVSNFKLTKEGGYSKSGFDNHSSKSAVPPAVLKNVERYYKKDVELFTKN